MAKKITTVDWDVLKAVYVNTNRTLEDIGKEYGVSCPAIQGQSARHGWTAERNKVQEAVSQAMAAEAFKRRMKAIEQMNDRQLEMSAQLAKHSAIKVKKAAIIDPETGEVVDTTMSHSEINAAALANSTIFKTERLAAGLSTDNTSFAGTVSAAEPVSLNETDAIKASKNYMTFMQHGG